MTLPIAVVTPAITSKLKNPLPLAYYCHSWQPLAISASCAPHRPRWSGPLWLGWRRRISVRHDYVQSADAIGDRFRYGHRLCAGLRLCRWNYRAVPGWVAFDGNRKLGIAASRFRRRHIDGLVAFHFERYEASGAELIMGTARIVEPQTVEVSLNDGGTRRLVAEKLFLNLGTHASIPSVPGLAEVEPLNSFQHRRMTVRFYPVVAAPDGSSHKTKPITGTAAFPKSRSPDR